MGAFMVNVFCLRFQQVQVIFHLILTQNDLTGGSIEDIVANETEFLTFVSCVQDNLQISTEFKNTSDDKWFTIDSVTFALGVLRK